MLTCTILLKNDESFEKFWNDKPKNYKKVFIIFLEITKKLCYKYVLKQTAGRDPKINL